MRRSLLPVSIALLLALAAAPAALGGGYATVGLSSTPAGVAAGEPWVVDVTVLAHGRTPVDGLAPILRIRSGHAEREFPAAPTAKTGVYRAKVVFPSAGRWRYEVADGYAGRVHTFPAVAIGEASGARVALAPAAAGGDDGDGWLWGAGAALLLAAGVLGMDRRRRSGTATPEAA